MNAQSRPATVCFKANLCHAFGIDLGKLLLFVVLLLLLLSCAAVTSSRALAGLAGVDAAAALALPGVVGLLTAADIPGANAVFDAPLLAGRHQTSSLHVNLHVSLHVRLT
jgi:hypothetical protein